MTAAVALSVGAARAEPSVPRVTEVWAATSDVWDVATFGDRTLVATSGGLVERRGDRLTRVIGTREGLPGQRARSVSVVGDEVWVGTVEGLAAVAWTGDDAPPAVTRRVDLPRVMRVVRLGGALFVASAGRGVFRIPDGAGAPVPLALGRAAERATPSDLLVRGDELWIATQGDGILRVAADGTLRGRVPLGPGSPALDIVWDLAHDGAGVLVGTAAGLRMVGPDGRVDPADARLPAAARLRVADVRAVLAVEPSAGTPSPARDPSASAPSGARDLSASAPSPARAGSTIVATWGAGVFRIDAGAARPSAIACSGCAQARVLATSGDDVLVGHDAGLARLPSSGGRAEVLATGGLPSSDVTALAHGLGALWIGTFGHGLARMGAHGPEAVERATSRWRMDRRINDLAVTRDAAGRETLWIATARGLWAHDGLRFWPIEAAGSPGRGYVMDLHVQGDGTLWVASSRALCRLAPDGRWTTWRTVGRHELEKLHAVTVDARGRVWLGSLHGLYVLDPRTGSLSRHSVSSGALPMDWVTALATTDDGVVAGTYSGGLVWFGPNGSVVEREREARAPATALPSGWVNPHAIARNGDEILVGTPGAGLLVGRQGAWRRLGPREGLPSVDVTATLEAGPGEQWIATRGGLARVRF